MFVNTLLIGGVCLYISNTIPKQNTIKEEAPYTSIVGASRHTYEDYRVFNISVTYKDGDAYFESIEEGTLDSIVVKKDYGMAENARMKVIAVIDGIEW